MNSLPVTKTSRKGLSVFLCVALLISMLVPPGITAHAAGSTTVTTLAELKTALNDSTDYDIINLTAAITIGVGDLTAGELNFTTHNNHEVTIVAAPGKRHFYVDPGIPTDVTLSFGGATTSETATDLDADGLPTEGGIDFEPLITLDGGGNGGGIMRYNSARTGQPANAAAMVPDSTWLTVKGVEVKDCVSDAWANGESIWFFYSTVANRVRMGAIGTTGRLNLTESYVHDNHNDPGTFNALNWGAQAAAGTVCSMGDMSLEDCIISGNTALAGGAFNTISNIEAENCRIANNTALTRGGVISDNNGGSGSSSHYFEFEDCAIVGNKSSESGGVVFSQANPQPAISWTPSVWLTGNTVLSNNESNTHVHNNSGQRGAILCDYLYIYDAITAKNNINHGTNSIYPANVNFPSFGGVASVFIATLDITEDSLFEGNEANNSVANGFHQGYGGAIHAYLMRIKTDNNSVLTFKDNRAVQGPNPSTGRSRGGRFR